MYTTAVTEGLEMGDKRERPAVISTNPVDSIFGTRPFRLRPFFWELGQDAANRDARKTTQAALL